MNNSKEVRMSPWSNLGRVLSLSVIASLNRAQFCNVESKQTPGYLKRPRNGTQARGCGVAALLPGGAPGRGYGALGAPQPWGPGTDRAHCADLGDHAGALPARYRPAAVGRTGGTAPAPHLPAPRAGFPAALPGCVPHGPRLRERPAPGGGQGGADSHGSSGHPPSALQTLHGAAAPAGPTLQGVPSLRPPLRPPLPLDGELCGGAQPPTLPGLPGAATGGASVGPVPGMVRSTTALGGGEQGRAACAHGCVQPGLPLQGPQTLSQVACPPGLPKLWAPIPMPPCRSGLRFFQPWGLWLRSSGLLFATFLLLSLLSAVAGLLLVSHLYLVATNTTTWEFVSSHRIAYLRQRPGNPFDHGLTRNLAHFFCGWPSGSWEALWAEEEEEGEGSSQAV